MPQSPSAAAPVITLRAAKYLRENHTNNLTPRQMASRLGITTKELAVIESVSPTVAVEPWLDLAVRYAMILQTEILPLLGVADLHELDLGFDPRDDVAVWRTGVNLPLSTACRLCLRFGLTDPLHLVVPPVGVTQEVWSIVASGERRSAPGNCPWCNASPGAVHLETCLPTFLWGVRDAPITTIGTAPTPARPGKRRGGSMPGRGLKGLRVRLGLTQEEFANAIGKHPNYYARLEQLRDPLNTSVAEQIAALYRIDVATLFADDAEIPAETDA